MGEGWQWESMQRHVTFEKTNLLQYEPSPSPSPGRKIIMAFSKSIGKVQRGVTLFPRDILDHIRVIWAGLKMSVPRTLPQIFQLACPWGDLAMSNFKKLYQYL